MPKLGRQRGLRWCTSSYRVENSPREATVYSGGREASVSLNRRNEGRALGYTEEMGNQWGENRRPGSGCEAGWGAGGGGLSDILFVHLSQDLYWHASKCFIYLIYDKQMANIRRKLLRMMYAFLASKTKTHTRMIFSLIFLLSVFIDGDRWPLCDYVTFGKILCLKKNFRPYIYVDI